MRVLRLATLLVVTVLKRRLAYRGDLALQMLDELMRGLMALALLQVYVGKSRDIGGWTGDQLLFVLGFALVPISLFHAFCGNLYGLNSRYVIQGELDRVLLRPYPIFLQICLDRVYLEDLGGSLLGLGLMVVAATRLPGFDWGPGHLLLLAGMLLSATALVMAVFMAFAALGFWFEDRIGMVPPVYNLMELGRFPDRIYPGALRLLITCVIPFSFVAFLPASLFVGDGPAWPGLATPLVALAALGIANLLWRAGLKRYESAGS